MAIYKDSGGGGGKGGLVGKLRMWERDTWRDDT